MKIIRYVSLIIFSDEAQRILVQDRQTMSKRGEEWGFFGGGIEPGETPEEAVVRETYEELRYTLNEPEFVGECDIEVVPDGTIGAHAYVFTAPLPALDAFDQHEGDGMRLCSIDEAYTLKMMTGDHRVLALMHAHFQKKRSKSSSSRTIQSA